jgi:hypothetical protein
MKFAWTLAALLLLPTSSTFATTPDADACEGNLVSTAAVLRRFEVAREIKAASDRDLGDEASSVDDVIQMIVSFSGAPAREVRSRLDELSARFAGSPELSEFAIDSMKAQLVALSLNRKVTIEELGERLEAVARALAPREADAKILFTLVKISLFYETPSIDLMTRLDEARGLAPEVESRVGAAQAEIFARHRTSGRGLASTRVTNEVLMAAIEASVAGDISVPRTMNVVERVLTDDVGATLIGAAKEGVIKASAALGWPIAASIDDLVAIDRRMYARLGAGTDPSVEALLMYMVLLGERTPSDVVDLYDRVVVTGRAFPEIENTAIVVRSLLDVANQAADPALLRSTLFNVFY